MAMRAAAQRQNRLRHKRQPQFQLSKRLAFQKCLCITALLPNLAQRLREAHHFGHTLKGDLYRTGTQLKLISISM